MKPTRSLIACLIALISIGCQAHKPPPPLPSEPDFKPKGPIRTGDREMNSGMVEDYYARQIDAGIIRQQTLYPYHFVVNGASFNALGRRDLYVLLQHYLVYPGNLRIRQGEEAKELYEARVKAVVDAMNEAGIRMDRVKITDGLPGGDGVTSDRVVLVMEAFQKPGGLAADSGGGSSSSTSDDSGISDSTQGAGTGSGSGTSMSTTGGY